MARTKGTLAISANFEVKMAEPMDARSRVATKAELLLAATWTSTDSNVYTYVGMPVSVYADGTAANNGIYRLKAADYTQAGNWGKMASADDISVLNSSKADYSGTNIRNSVSSIVTADVEKSVYSETALYDAAGNEITEFYQIALGFTPEVAGVAATLISNLKNGVSTNGDTLKKLYDLIVASFTEVTVANTTARNALNISKLPTNVFVTDDGDGKWALYKATTTGIGATYVKISDPDLLNAAMSAAAIKASYESNSDTNAFTNALLSKLNDLTKYTDANALAVALTGISASGIRTNISAADSVLAAFGKVIKWFGDLGTLAFKSSIDYTSSDITNKPDLSTKAQTLNLVSITTLPAGNANKWFYKSSTKEICQIDESGIETLSNDIAESGVLYSYAGLIYEFNGTSLEKIGNQTNLLSLIYAAL